MLIKITIENYKSFDKREELSMVSSSKIQTLKNHRIKIKQTQLLKNAAVYGANASGKSNLVAAFSFIKTVLAEGLPINSANDFCRTVEENRMRESRFELLFTVGERFYAYGFSAILSQRKITAEWLFELLQDGGAREMFSREENAVPTLGTAIRLSASETGRFKIYAEDFAGQNSRLFLSEMNRGKKYPPNSKLLFFTETFLWITNNIIVVTPETGLSDTKAYSSEKSLESISTLIQTFDTGVSSVKTQRITVDELASMTSPEAAQELFKHLQIQMENTGRSDIHTTWRTKEGFFDIRIANGKEPEIKTLVLRHGKSAFDFSFTEESEGTKRLFDMMDMLLTDKSDTVFVVDELERSLHPKLTEHFLKVFSEAHEGVRIQLVFVTHEESIMDQTLFRRDEIWFVERDANNASRIYSLARFKERYDKVLGKAYLDGRYGAVPVFRRFSFREGGQD